MRVILSFVLLCLITSAGLLAQTTNPANVNVQELSDDQILKLISEIEKRGLSENDAIAMAKARGMSQAQIDLLKKRIADTKTKSAQNSHRKVTGLGVVTETKPESDIFSQKVEVDSAIVDQRIFGFSLFNNEKLTFDPSVNIPVSQGYVLGAGDELIIDVWGLSQQTYELTIDRNGFVQIPLLGPVAVGGITLGEATSLLNSRLSTLYGDLKSSSPRTFMSVRTGELKPIRINVIGEVFAPGTYTVPGTASLFNVLYLSGGPSATGSFRDIKLIRAGKVMASLDVYDFLINGNAEVNVPLHDNDIVMVPTYINRVIMDGFFKRKGIFEAKEGETVADMVNYAGGFQTEANRSRIELYRISKMTKEFKDVTADNMTSLAVAGGDSIYVGKVIDRFDNMVTIKAGVFMPGNYEFTDGLTLSALISKSGGLMENTFLDRGFVERLKPDYTKENISFSVRDAASGRSDIDLKKGDVVYLNLIDDMQEKRMVSISGMVQVEGRYPYNEGMSLGDLILLAGGFKESASGASIEIMRKLSYDEAEKSTSKTANIFTYPISRQLELSDGGASFALMPFDEISVRKMPGYRETGNVKIQGQVYYAGTYGLSSYTERVSDLLKRAGGVTPNAYVAGAKLVRKIKFSNEELERRKELQRKDTTFHISDLEFEVISINLAKIEKNPGTKEDIFLEDGDELTIPGFMATVKMSGQVLNPSSTVYIDGLSAKNYVNLSGGFANDARKGRLYVIYPNGASAATKGGFLFRNYPKVLPGSEIVVPRRPQREGMSAQAWIGLGSALASIGLTVATILTLNK